jgi:hypothetical protein
VGTRFAAFDESSAHPRYVGALIAAGPSYTMLSDYFSYEFPGLPQQVRGITGRVLDNGGGHTR